MSTPDAYARADARVAELERVAREKYPEAYFLDRRSDGWPDMRAEVAVYARVLDARHRDGWKLERIGTVTGADLT